MFFLVAYIYNDTVYIYIYSIVILKLKSLFLGGGPTLMAGGDSFC